MAYFIDIDSGRAISNDSVLQLYVSEEKIRAKVVSGSDVTHSVYNSEAAATAAFQGVANSLFGGASGGGIGSCFDCDSSRVVLGSGLIKHDGGRLSDKITIPADAQEVSLSSKYRFWVTTDGVTNAHRSGRGIMVQKSTIWIRGQELVKNIRIDSVNKNVWVEFYSIPGSATTGGGHD